MEEEYKGDGEWDSVRGYWVVVEGLLAPQTASPPSAVYYFLN